MNYSLLDWNFEEKFCAIKKRQWFAGAFLLNGGRAGI
jgi:uncharacterized membrane protein